MADLWSWIDKIRSFLQRGIWEVEFEQLSRARAFVLRQAQLLLVVYQGFMADRLLLRASALTYFTLLSIVPLFALAFSVLKGLGVQRTLQPLIIERLTVGMDEVDYIITYIERTNVGTLGAAGLVTLVVTVLFLLSNIEESFNHIWGIRETRPLFRRFADYFSVLVIGPIFIFAAISMTSALESHALVQRLLETAVVGEAVLLAFRFAPFVVMWIAFALLYIFMPNIKVQIKAALIGGVIGGTLWQLSQWGYVSFQFGMARYNAIYGTMAALPILMFWVYISWTIVLLGAEIAYAVQNINIIRQENRQQKINYLSQEMTALSIMALVACVFERGERPWTAVAISEKLGLPPRLTRSVLEELVHFGFLTPVSEAEEHEAGYQPACPPEKMPVHQIMQKLREGGANLDHPRAAAEWRLARNLEKRLAEADSRALEGMTVGDMVKMLESKVTSDE